MKRYLITVITIIALVSCVLLGCDSNEDSQAEIEALRSELEQLKEEKRIETIQQAEAYYAILEFCATGASESSGFQLATPENVAEMLVTCSEFWSLIRATEDPYLLSLCQPQGEWNLTPCNCNQIYTYCEENYKELMSEYYSQSYINEQLYKLEQARQEAIAQAQKIAEEESERIAAIDNLPVTYTGKGSGRTPTFWTSRGSSNQYKLTLTATWSGGISINWYQEDTSGTGASLIELKADQVWRTTGISFGFPSEVIAGVTYEYIFNWNQSQKAVYFDIANVPENGEWMITISQVDIPFLRPQFGITLVIEYDGEFAYQSTTGTSWGISWFGVLSGNYSREMEISQFPIHFRARKDDGGVNPLVLKIIYDGQVVIEDTAIGDDDEAWIYWEGPH